MTAVTNSENRNSEQNKGEDTKNSPTGMGIPRGNTVAVVGDPGTGKTTFLLTYVAHGKLQTIDGNSWQQVVRLQDKKRRRIKTFEAINNLFMPAQARNRRGKKESEGSGANKPATLRCFISLENNLSRILDNHSALLEQYSDNLTDDNSDQFMMIDATAFLSGRLDDRLRYPRLKNSIQEERPDFGKKYSYDLNLGGHNLGEDEYFGLYYQADNKDPKRIEQLDDDAAPFSRKAPGDNKPIMCRSFNLITRPISDPFQRVRLLKDLLAEVFIRFPQCKHRLLAIDSLSALMNPFGEDDLPANASPARRLNILNLVRWLEEYGVTTFLACEAEHDAEKTWGGHPLFLGTEERYLTSGVIQLNYHEYPSGDIVRYLRVLKMRGAAHDMRPHAYELGDSGITWIEPLFGEAGKAR